LSHPGEPVDPFFVADALENWLLAYETAGASGGGPPDPVFVAEARKIKLPAGEHKNVRFAAFEVQALYLGPTEHHLIPPLMPGLFTSPIVVDPCEPILPEDNGSVGALDADLLGVAELIRQAMVMELRNPGHGEFDFYMGQIEPFYPGYSPLGRCEFPAPPELGDFGYTDGIDCVTERLRAVVHFLVAEPPAGDINLDGEVNFLDVAFVAEDWLWSVPPEVDLVENGSFEEIGGDPAHPEYPSNWSYNPLAFWDDITFYEGNASLHVEGSGETHSVPELILNPKTTYQLSAWMKTNGVVAGGLFVSCSVQPSGEAWGTWSSEVTGTTDWVFRSAIFTTPGDTAMGTVECVWTIEGGGEGWFDSIRLTALYGE
jgi:hypothetical protein